MGTHVAVVLTRIAVVSVTIVLVIGCGVARPSGAPASIEPTPPGFATAEPRPATAAPTPLVTPLPIADPTVILTCSGPERFPAAALAGIGLAEFESDAAAAILTSVIAEDGDPDMFPDHGWHRVATDPTGVVFVAMGPGDPAWVMVHAALGPDGWTVGGYGACQLQPALPQGVWPADFWLDPDAPPPAADATTLQGLIRERACASGERPVGRVRPPVVVFDDDSVVVIVTVSEKPGGADCPGNPSMPIVIELGQPLGDRSVLDGSVFPARDASVAPG